MIRQILKHISVLLPIALACSTCFGQFKEINPREGRLKGKVDSVVFNNFNFIKSDTGEVREFNDKCTYVYNAKGFLIEELSSDEEGTDQEIFKTVYIYDAKGDHSQVLDYGQKGILQKKEIYTFDPAKRLVKMSAAGTVTTKIQLDKSGNITENIIYHKYPLPFSTFRYRYNREGLCIESIQSWSKSAGLQKISYEYDTYGNLIQETIDNNSKLSCTYTYRYSQYDKMGNWLIQHTYKNGTPDGVTERSIHYQ
ncbi:MAG: hypothetical protein V4594_13785 [Bacteroidota bacterium]